MIELGRIVGMTMRHGRAAGARKKQNRAARDFDCRRIRHVRALGSFRARQVKVLECRATRVTGNERQRQSQRHRGETGPVQYTRKIHG